MLLLPFNLRLICVVEKRKDVERINQENHVESLRKVVAVEKPKDHAESARNLVENQNHVKIAGVEPVKE
jgi:hypothetical protein